MKKNILFINKIKKYYLKLLQKDNSLILHSFSHLYFKNTHPNFIDATDIFKKKKFNILKFVSYLIKKFILSDRINQNIQREKVDILILSHRLKNVKNKDIYFGSFKKKLKKKILNVFINHTSILSKNFLLEKNTILLSTRLNFLKELLLIIRVILFSINNLNIFRYHKKLNSRLSLISQSLHNMRIYEQLKKILIKFEPKSVVFTYEGYAYERLICKLCTDLNIKSFGFQTSVIIPSSYSIFQNYTEEYNPDIIFTPNKYYENIFKKKSNFKKTKIIFLATKQLSRKNYHKFKNNNKDNILVLPEGIPSECYTLFKFSYKLAQKNKKLRFIWRIHPILEWKEIIEKLNIFNLPKNIKISNSNLYKDIKKSKYCLYRGSGSVIEALTNNVLPIYLKNSNDIEKIDPLYQYNKNVIQTEKDFLILFNKYRNKKKYNNELKKFRKFLNIFYQKTRSNNFKYF